MSEEKKFWKIKGQFLNTKGKSTVIYTDESIRSEAHYLDCVLHSEEGPSVIITLLKTNEVILEKWYRYGIKVFEIWYKGGKYHRHGKPAVIEYDGCKRIEYWYTEGELERTLVIEDE